MEAQNRVMVTANIRRETNQKKKKLFYAVYLIIIALFLIVGLYVGYDDSYFDKENLGDMITIYDTQVGWFNVPFYEKGSRSFNWFLKYDGGWRSTTATHSRNIIGVTVLFVFLFGAPFFVDAIYKRQCKNTALSVSESKVFGSYSSFLSKKIFEMPIEQIDSVTIVSGKMDMWRTGATLVICSAFSAIKLHFVQNAEEMASIITNRKEKKEHIVEQIAAESASASTSDKLKELLEIKESGLITEEEFSKKKKEILSNM